MVNILLAYTGHKKAARPLASPLCNLLLHRFVLLWFLLLLFVRNAFCHEIK